jgi:hypothetical protein
MPLPLTSPNQRYVGEFARVHHLGVAAVTGLADVARILSDLPDETSARHDSAPVESCVDLRIDGFREPAAAAAGLFRQVAVVKLPPDAQVERNARVCQAVLQERGEIPHMRLLHQRRVVCEDLRRSRNAVHVAEAQPRIAKHLELVGPPALPRFETELHLVTRTKQAILISRQRGVHLKAIRVAHSLAGGFGSAEHTGRDVLDCSGLLRFRQSVELIGVSTWPVHPEKTR